jgi:hypothetical protein
MNSTGRWQVGQFTVRTGAVGMEGSRVLMSGIIARGRWLGWLTGLDASRIKLSRRI